MAQQHIFLGVGDLVISDKSEIIDATVADSVVVCLYCESLKIGGAVHFALPTGNAKGFLGSADTAIAKLVTEFKSEFNVEPSALLAKIVGGCDNAGKSGKLNIEAARAKLKEFGIKIAGESTGGAVNRRLLFYIMTGRLQVAAVEFLEDPTRTIANTGRTAESQQKRRVLIVDDAKVIRELLSRVLSEDPDLEVVGLAADAFEAEKLIDKLRPDVITLDVHMPGMDGPTFLERLLPRRPIPVVMITAISMEEGDYVLRALELGAVDYIQKPSLNELATVAPMIREKVKQASFAKAKYRPGNTKGLVSKSYLQSSLDTSFILAIGASTGGTEAIREVLQGLPENIPPTLIVQHIPPVFSTAFAQRLDSLCPFTVKEGEDGEPVAPGKVLIAPGGKQMALQRTSSGFVVRVNDDPPMNRHKPSVDYLFNTVAELVGAKSVGVILTGMGNDGAAGLLKMRKAGAWTIGQSEDSCVVYGMPRVAAEVGALAEVSHLSEVPSKVISKLTRRMAA